MWAQGVVQDPLPGRLYTVARSENVPAAVSRGGGVPEVAEVAGPGVLLIPVRMNGGARVKPAPPAVRVASPAHQLDEVRDEEGRGLGTPGKKELRDRLSQLIPT